MTARWGWGGLVSGELRHTDVGAVEKLWLWTDEEYPLSVLWKQPITLGLLPIIPAPGRPRENSMNSRLACTVE